MIDPELLAILVCPEAHIPVHPADPGLLARVNAAIADGTMRTLGGEVVSEPLEEALLREDGARLYPVRDGIPVMLIDEALPVADLS